MLNENFKIRFEEFTPSTSLKSQARSFIEKALDPSPSDSYIDLIIRKSGISLLAQLSVASREGRFTCSATGENPRELFLMLSKNLRAQLKLWSSDRFLGEVL